MNEQEKSEGRMKILLDVKKQLKILNIKEMTYFSGSLNNDVLDGDYLQQNMPILIKNCEVCAIGAMFIGFVDVFNNIKIDNVNVVLNNGHFRVKNYFMRSKLNKYFSDSQLKLIEGVFERWWGSNCFYGTLNPKKRFEAIVDNMIEHNGILILELKPYLINGIPATAEEIINEAEKLGYDGDGIFVTSKAAQVLRDNGYTVELNR